MKGDSVKSDILDNLKKAIERKKQNLELLKMAQTDRQMLIAIATIDKELEE